MSEIIITIQPGNTIKIQAGSETLSPVSFENYYASPERGMRLARKVADLLECYVREVEQRTDKHKIKRARNHIIKGLAEIGRETAENIFDREDWERIWDLLRRFPGAEIRIEFQDKMAPVWIPWELLCYFQEGDTPDLDSFIASKRNIYRILGKVPSGYVKTISEAGLLAWSEWRTAEESFIEETGIRLRRTTMPKSEEQGPSLTNLNQCLKSTDIVHIASVIVPLQHAKISWLLIDRDVHLSERDLRRRLAEPGRRERRMSRSMFSLGRNPLIILNVRDNYCRDPQQIFRYVRLFLDSEAVGVITSEFPVSPRLALEFSELFYRRLSRNGRSLGQILADTKSTLLGNGNPFAMFYAPYFRPDIRLEIEREYTKKGEHRTMNTQSGKPRALSHPDRSRLIQVLVQHPAWAQGRNGERSVLRGAGIPDKWIQNYSLTGAPAVDAKNVVADLEKLGHLHDRPNYYAIGALVDHLLQESSDVEGKFFLAHLIEHYRLVTDTSYLEQLRKQYNLLSPAPADLGWNNVKSPPWPWHGPDDEQELERIWRPEAPLLDVVFLEQGAKCAQAVCRVEDKDGGAWGTGFLIGPNLVLTNYHVVREMDRFKRGCCRVRFGYRRDAAGNVSKGTVYRVTTRLASSPVRDLDYVVLEIDGEPGLESEFGYLRLRDVSVVKRDRVYVIQHPRGKPQKVVLQENQVTYVSPDRRRVQYLANTLHGSSGAPVFNKNWQVVALHHRGRPVPASPGKFSGNEGILISAILPEIQSLLPGTV